jgi:hypothetical protein
MIRLSTSMGEGEKSMAVWKIGTGEHRELIREFLTKGVVAIGWPQMGDLGRFATRDEFCGKQETSIRI